MDWWLFTFFIGAIFSLFSPIVPAIFQLFCFLFLALFIFYYKPLRTSSGLLFGAIFVLFHGMDYQTKISDEITALMFSKKSMDIEGEVLNIQSFYVSNSEKGNPNLKEKLANSQREISKFTQNQALKLNVKITHVHDVILEDPFIARVNWRKPEVAIFQGQTLKISVKLKPAHGLANLGSFSYQSWLKSQLISATGYVVKAKVDPLNTENNNHLTKYHIQGEASFRQNLFNQYTAILSEHQLAPLLLALAFGERSSLAKEHWDVLKATGTGHLIAISGLHIGLVASGSFFIVMFLVRLLPTKIFIKLWPKSPSFQQYNIRYIAIFFSMLSALIYGYLAGYSLPTQRALVMLSLYWFSRISLIHLSTKRWLLITLFILVTMNPFSLFTASFWLSVYAVSVIFVTMWRYRLWLNGGSAIIRFVKSLLIIQCSLTLMILPITAIFFHQISSVAFLANMIAVPWMSLITIPLTLLSVLVMQIESLVSVLFSGQSDYFISKFLIVISTDSLNLLWRWLNLLTNLDNSTVNVSLFKQVGLVVFGILSFLILFIVPRYLKINSIKGKHLFRFDAMRLIEASKNRFLLCGGLVVIFTLVFFYRTANIFDSQIFISVNNQQKSNEREAPSNNGWQLVMFDVGQGLSVLIMSDERAILYDTGAAFPSGFNMSDAVILPYLQYKNIKDLDKVILSHSDNDHAGGLKQLQRGINIKQLITNDKNILNHHKINDSQDSLTCYRGNKFYWEGLSFQVLWPIKPDTTKKQRNDDSCVVLVSSGSKSVLLTGDISKKTERQLINHYPDLKVDILIVPHHGSNTSSSDEFLRHLSPDIALVSAGFINRWKMPTSDVMNRYNKNDIKLINTADSGQIFVSFNESEIRLNTYREYFRPFWFSN